MRAGLACAPDGADASDRPGADDRHLRAVLAYGRRAPPFADRNGDGLARHLGEFSRRKSAAAAASILAQQRLAEAESVVRNGSAAFPALGNPLSPWLGIQQEITRF